MLLVPWGRVLRRALVLTAVVVATLATVIASQALISGAFSLTLQAVQLGYSPRVQIEHTSERDSELMLTGLEIRESDVPSIVIGDLNDVAWSKGNREFLKLSGLLDPRVGRGFYHTFDARSWFVRYPIDHIFHTQEFRLGDLQVLEPIGSDHHPVLIDLSFEPEVESEQPAPEPDAVRPHNDVTVRVDGGYLELRLSPVSWTAVALTTSRP